MSQRRSDANHLHFKDHPKPRTMGGGCTSHSRIQTIRTRICRPTNNHPDSGQGSHHPQTWLRRVSQIAWIKPLAPKGSLPESWTWETPKPAGSRFLLQSSLENQWPYLPYNPTDKPIPYMPADLLDAYRLYLATYIYLKPTISHTNLPTLFT